MRKYLFLFILLLFSGLLFAQSNVIDKIVAIVGEEIILKSDIENEFLNEQSQGMISSSSDYRADILEKQLIQKLLVAQAKIDSVVVTEDEVESEINNRIQYFISVLGSQERVESYFSKNMADIKNDMRAPTREKLIAESMQQRIVEKIRNTPSEVKAFYKKLAKDSLPDIPDKYEIQQIVLKPTISEAEKERLRDRLRTFREQILNGEKTFNTLAVLYSEDGAASRGGELGYMAKSEMVPEFAEAAFNLKPGRISKIVETEFGFHIIQLIDRQGEKINARHIILQPKVSQEEREEALHRLDTVRSLITDKKMTFEEAAHYFSTDKKTRNNGGLVASMDGDSKIERAAISGETARHTNRMKVGEISEPFTEQTEHGEELKIIKIKAFYPQHKANLEDDWMIFEAMLKREKQMDKLEKWIKEKQADTYIHLDDAYKNSKFRYDGWIK
ncbi:peptidylprolyl isomerase [Odoribacter lunatus]|uniref:peptidylprolyl isomerase n=1 Tax=Odoribacter lunatus TaxID=2941335 RepID=UPI00203CC5FB|nr:peptidylprolyl isomerase [Odoribacter lunatus]